MISRELHVISTGKQPFQELAKISSEIHPYINYLHIREKGKTARELHDGIQMLMKNGVPPSKIIVNDRVDVAFTMKTAGTHLGFHSLEASIVKKEFPSLKVGSSVHSLSEAKTAVEQGADYIIYGHIFSTNSKKGIQPRGIVELTTICEKLPIPVIAIGGIKLENIKSVLNAGVNGVAVMSGILEAENPLYTVKKYYETLRGE